MKELFSQYGNVNDVHLIMDRETQRSRGFGFVTLGSAQEGQAAIDALHGKSIDGRNLTVNEAKPMEPRRDSRGGGGGGGGGRGRY